MLKTRLNIINKLGLHARAAAKFVETASRFSSEVEISNGHRTVSGKSIMGVMMLGASKGTEIEIIATGTDEAEVIQALTTLVNNRFDEKE